VTSPRFAMAVLLVEELQRSVAFYQQLGVEFPANLGDRPSVVVEIGGGHKLVLTTTFGSLVPGLQPSSGVARVILEFFVDTRTAVDALYASLTAVGHTGRRPPFLTDFNAYMCMIDDPDGNTVLITAE
jgi:predicted lactoylglutathione lyase